MKTTRASRLVSIAAGLAVALGLATLLNVVIPVVGAIEFVAAAITVLGLASVFGLDAGRRPAAQGVRPPAAIVVRRAAAQPAVARLSAYGPRAAAAPRRTARALVGAA